MLGSRDFPREGKGRFLGSAAWEHMGLGRWAELSSISGLTSLWWLLLHGKMWVQRTEQWLMSCRWLQS